MMQLFDKFIQAQFAKDSINDSFSFCILTEKLAKLVFLSCYDHKQGTKFYGEVSIENLQATKK